MTQPTHGLDPNALEAARKWPDLAAIEAAARKVNPGRSEDHIKSVALDALSIIRALSQNPGTSNTGEAVVWRGHEIPIRCPYPEYGRIGAPIAYDIDPGQGSATNRLVRDWPHEEYIDHLRISDGEITPLFAALEPPASDRGAELIELTPENVETVARAVVAEWGDPDEDYMGGPLWQAHTYIGKRAIEAVNAIRKLSEVSQ